MVACVNKLDMTRLRPEKDKAKFGFIIAELDLARTFCERASAASDGTDCERNLGNALKAYGAAVRFAKRAKLTPEQSEEIKEKIGRFDAALSRISARI